MRLPRQVLVLALGVSVFCVCGHAQDSSGAPGVASETGASAAAESNYASDPSFQAALADAKQNSGSPEDRLSSWAQANALAKNRCVECLEAMTGIYFTTREWNAAAETAIRMLAVSTNARDKFEANASAGKALMHSESGYPSLEQYGRAEEYLRAALNASPRSSQFLYLEGEVLATLGRNDEAKAMFERCLKVVRDSDPRHADLLQFIEDPHLATRGSQTSAAGRSSSSSSAPAAASVTVPEPAYAGDAKFQKALAQAKELRQMPEDRLDNWKHANKIVHGQCVECLRQIITLQMQLGAYQDALTSAKQMEAVSTEARDRIFAWSQQGFALMDFNSGQPKPEQVQQAEAAFHQVLTQAPRVASVMFDDGRALAMLGKNDEAKAMFERYVDAVPASDKLRNRAARFSDDPHLATLQMAPPFKLVTSDGRQMQLDDMSGKVVLLDFWATWCGPCKESLPQIARVAKDYANDPMLVVISVSSDADPGVWRTFVEKNRMVWPQYRDTNGALMRAYGVSAIPHFFTIDTNGVLKTEQVGSNANVAIIVDDLVKKAHKAEARRLKDVDKSSGQ